MGDRPPSASAHAKPPRLRIRRACNHCRRRKTKCDGNLPCDACAIIRLQCSYAEDQRPLRGNDYVAYLEGKVDRLEHMLRRASSSSSTAATPQSSPVGDATPTPFHETLSQARDLSHIYTTMSGDVHLLAPIETTRAVIAADSKPARPSSNAGSGHQHSSASLVSHASSPQAYNDFAALEAIRRLRLLCSQMARQPVHWPDSSATRMTLSMDHNLPSTAQHHRSNLLLPQAEMSRYVEIAFAEAFCHWPFLDLERIQSYTALHMPADDSTMDQRHKIATSLLYMVVALGMRHEALGPEASPVLDRSRELRGFDFYLQATQVVDIRTCANSLESLQVMICMAMYALCTNAVTTAQAYSKAAAIAAMSLGLSAQSLPESAIPELRRIWSTVRMLDAYTTSALGLPRYIQIDDLVDDRFPRMSSSDDLEQLQLCNAHSRLTDILSRAVEASEAGASAGRGTSFSSATPPDSDDMYSSWAQVQDWRLENSLESYPCTSEPWVRFRIILELLAEYVHMLMSWRFLLDLGVSTLQSTDPSNADLALGCIKSAVSSIMLIDALRVRAVIAEACPCVLPTLALSAIILLVTKFGDDLRLPANVLDNVKYARGLARQLLQDLSLESFVATECLESLKPLI